MPPESLTHAAKLLKSADGLIITAGAGMGVDSGLPDLRGNAGFWQHYPALAEAKLSFSQIANPNRFYYQPELAWGFYGHRLKLYRQTQPHEGFQLLLTLAQQMKQGYFVFTSNVDGQFQKAGFNSNRIYECHGSIHALQCLHPCDDNTWTANHFQPNIDEQTCQLLSSKPRCPMCGGIARPNILMFNDGGWLGGVYEQQEARLNAWLQTIESPVVIEIGAGISIPTVRLFGERFMNRLIRINPTDAKIPYKKGVSLAMGGLEGLRLLTQAIQPTDLI